MTLTEVPQEILIEILKGLDTKSLLCCGSTCRMIYEICVTTPELRYTIDLAMDGFSERVIKTSYTDLLARMHELRLSWAKLVWKRTTEVDLHVKRNHIRIYRLVAGVFAMTNGEKISFTWLPTSTRNYHRRSIEYLSIGSEISTFAIDPTQDLLVVWERNPGRFHIRTLSTSHVHPLAARGLLEYEGDITLPARLEITVDVVGFVTDSNFSVRRLMIWNWKKGVLIYDSHSIGQPLAHHITNFSFLSEDAFMLASKDAQGALFLYSFDPSSPDLSIPTLCATLHLLTMSILFKFEIHSSPIYPAHPDISTFWSLTESHVVVLSLYYVTDTSYGFLENYVVYLHKHTLLDYVHQFRQQASATRSSPIAFPNLNVDWKVWGEKNVRFMKAPPTGSFTCVYGQRVIISYEEDTVEVLNFNIPSSTSVSAKAPSFVLHAEPSFEEPYSTVS
ncbi:hypothetical protein CPB84DRAFT_261744 [Gymnopilus junonius]|uniref:F-box domain-containing protein n=1 Tax=Gymnopilus junonius TaxID=109634 RepID=A0A9P5NE28_GYMJU|nr:hypothetical protein CPB84DRAFT_261744 [Gymnopilus junonius]